MTPPRDFLAISRRLLEVLGADGLGDEGDQRRFAVDGLEPSWVAMPSTVEQASAVLAIANEYDLAVVPAGLGRRLDQGFPPERCDLLLTTERLARIVEHASADLTLTVEAGATLAAIDEALRPSGQWLPLDPASPEATTIGGLIAAQPTGPCRQRHGGPREWLLGVRALLADGTLVKSGGHVVKNVAGYDLQKLLVGSFGSLALVVEATFKLAPRPRARKLLRFASEDRGALLRVASGVADSVFEPELVELLVADDGTSELVVGVAGTKADVEAASRGVEGIAAAQSLAGASSYDPNEIRRRHADLQAAAPTSLVIRAGIRRDRLGPWLEGALGALRPFGESLAASAHAGIGVARLRLEAARRDEIASVVERLRDEARPGGGYLVIEQAPREWKATTDVWGSSPVADLTRGVKQAFDPRRRFSPGRFVGRI